jgi:sugar/nucleoside kinase (ribokinase family)
MKSKNPRPYAVGVGSALMDILLFESDGFVAEHGLIKGGMEMVDAGRADELLAASARGAAARRVPGGSSCNTTIGLGRLCGKAVFVGTRGDDDLGGILEASIAANDVEARLRKVAAPTGRVLSVVTPDAERTMLTCLGASSETSADQISPELFRGADLVHVEGYLLFNEPVIRAVFESAEAAGVPASLDLASFTVVEAKLALAKELVQKHVAVLLANEDEARSYTGASDEREALEILAGDAECAVVKVGKRGSLVSLGGEVTTVAPVGDGGAVDTTGAGDLWASGFLYGLISGKPVAECGRIASLCGYEVCQVEGAHIPEEGWRRIKAAIG